MLHRLRPVETCIFLGLLLGLCWIGQRQFLFDPGCFWSTVVGRNILETGEVPRQDQFSCTFDGVPWHSHQWLAQVGMALLHAVGGLDALVLGAAALLAATYIWVFGRLRGAGLHWIATGFVLALLLSSSRHHWLARPQLVTIALLGWTFAQLVDLEAGTVSWRRLWLLPPAFVLWTNLHGGALGGLFTLGIVGAGWCGARLIGRPSPVQSSSDLGRLLLLGIACGLATFVNPYGWELPLGWVRLMGLQTLSRYIYEHMPLDWSNPYQRGILVFGLVYVLALATVPVRKWRVTWLVPVVWLFLTLQRVRHCTLFGITAAVALADLMPHSRLAEWARNVEFVLVAPPASRSPDDRPNLAWVLPACLVALALILQACAVPVPLIGAGQATIDPGLVPTELVGPIRERSAPGTPIFNEMAYGGFLIHYLPELKVYIDDRCELYGDDFIAQQQELAGAFQEQRRRGEVPTPHEELERDLKARGIRLALVIKDRGFDHYFRSLPHLWNLVAATEGQVSPASVPGAVLYERKRGE